MKEELSTQQKLWIWGRAFLTSIKPLLLYILMPALCMSIGYVAFHLDMSASEFFSYGGNFYTAVGMSFTLFLLYRGSKKKGSSFFEDATFSLHGVSKGKAACFFCFGLACAVCLSSLLTLLPEWGIMESYAGTSQAVFQGNDFLFIAVTTVLLAPLTEEIVFRGYMFNTLLQTFEEKTAVWIVSIVFALCHTQPVWILYSLGMGLLLTWISLREHNIFQGILLHIGFNFPSVVTWMLQSNQRTAELFYGNRILIAGYGLIGAITAWILAYRYWTMGEKDCWEEMDS